MALLKRKAEKTTTISVRIPVSTKEKMLSLRQLADTQGYDLTASLTEAVINWMRQAHKELSSNSPAIA